MSMTIADQLAIDSLSPELRALVDAYVRSDPTGQLERLDRRVFEMGYEVRAAREGSAAWEAYAGHLESCAVCNNIIKPPCTKGEKLKTLATKL